MALSGKEKRKLRSLSNRLKPEIWIGKEGVSSGTIQTLLNAFNTKELVKVKILDNCPQEHKLIVLELSKGSDSELIQHVGHTLTFYKPLPEE